MAVPSHKLALHSRFTQCVDECTDPAMISILALYLNLHNPMFVQLLGKVGSHNGACLFVSLVHLGLEQIYRQLISSLR